MSQELKIVRSTKEQNAQKSQERKSAKNIKNLVMSTKELRVKKS
jgi:hypothetical protein